MNTKSVCMHKYIHMYTHTGITKLTYIYIHSTLTTTRHTHIDVLYSHMEASGIVGDIL